MGLSSASPVATGVDPLDVVAAWPTDRPLFVLHSGDGDPRWGRWTVIAGPRGRIAAGPASAEALSGIRLSGGRSSGLPFAGGWIGYLGYGLGALLEPALGAPRGDDRGWPAAELFSCPDALLLHHPSGRWRAVGAPPAVEPVARAGAGESFRAGPPAGSADPDACLAAIARAIEYIAAGDVFQVNVTRRLSAPFEGSTRRLFIDAMRLSRARYGAYLELPDGRCLVSLSPELFLDVDGGSRQVVTRPVKGTRPSSRPREELAASAKDAAELAMIVDLMRNDLGRVCEIGSVRVRCGRAIETHRTVHHGVGEVAGRLRPGVELLELLAATFPPGSVTGAPKIRAMQIIDELEPATRGPYCGAIGWVSPAGRTVFNVAIRTLVLTGRRDGGRWDRLEGFLDYGTGGGVVADSDPAAEYRESEDKARILRMVLGVASRHHGIMAT